MTVAVDEFSFHLVAIEVAQKRRLRLGFDAFRDDPKIQRLTQGNHRAGDERRQPETPCLISDESIFKRSTSSGAIRLPESPLRMPRVFHCLASARL